MRIKLGLAQIYPKLGDLEHNLALHLDYVRQAQAQGVNLLVFPELSLTGYQVQDLAPEVAIASDAGDEVFGALLEASAEIDIVVGFVHRDQRNRFYIANAYLSAGEALHVHHKLYLPTYAMFDDSRYFAQGNSVRAFDTRFGRLGMLICEDFWHVSPAYLLWLDGADILILNSSSPIARAQRERPPHGHALGRDGQSGLRQHVHLLHRALQPRRLRRRQEFLGRFVGGRSRRRVHDAWFLL